MGQLQDGEKSVCNGKSATGRGFLTENIDDAADHEDAYRMHAGPGAPQVSACMWGRAAAVNHGHTGLPAATSHA